MTQTYCTCGCSFIEPETFVCSSCRKVNQDIRRMHRQSDTDAINIQEGLSVGDFTLDESSLASSRLSSRCTAQLDLESGQLELCTENGIEVFDAEEVLELFQLIGNHRATLYARFRDK